MKKILILIVLFTVGCGTQNQKCDKVDPEQVKQVIVDFLYAGNYSDFEKLKNITTADFLLYFDGEEMNLNELIQFIKDWPEPDKYKFDEFDFEIETDCNSAFAKYYYGPPRSDRDSTRVDRYDLQSVYLKRIGNNLKLNFLHLTTAKQ